MPRRTCDDREAEEIDPAHLPAVLEGLAQAERREFATDAEVEAAFRRFDQSASFRGRSTKRMGRRIKPGDDKT
jgi:hypothetical protein